MSALFYILIVATLSSAFADQELESFAQNVLEALQTNLAATQKGSNSVLLSFTNGEHLSFSLLSEVNQTNKVRVNVTFSGSVQVSAERNTNRVTLSRVYNGGAVLAVNEKENDAAGFVSPQAVKEGETDAHLEALYKNALESQEDLLDDETSVVLGHAASTGVGIKAGKRRAEAKIVGGFVVGVVDKVSKK